MKNIELEQKVIGAIVGTPDLYFETGGMITAHSFYTHDYSVTFQAVEDLHGKGQQVTVDTLQNHIKKEGEKFNVYDLLGHSVSHLSFLDSCLILRQFEISREQIKLGVNLATLGNDEKIDPLTTNDMLLSEAERITSLTDMSKPQTNAELLKACTEKMELASKSQGLTGISTGFTMLDKMYGGRQGGNLIIKAGRPAMGKTAQALCEAYNMAYLGNKKVTFVSLEMSAEELMQRLVSVHTGIPVTTLQEGSLTDSEWTTYTQAIEVLSNSNLTIIDDVFTLSGIRTRCKKMHMKKELDVVFIDYLQLIVHSSGKGRSQENDLSDISRSLKMMAKQLKAPVIALSQLNRMSESTSENRPNMSHLRGSGAIEQDADVIELLYRPEYYGHDTDGNGDSTEGLAYIIIAKNRHGGMKDVKFRFNKECTRFEDPETIQTYQAPTQEYAPITSSWTDDI